MNNNMHNNQQNFGRQIGKFHNQLFTSYLSQIHVPQTNPHCPPQIQFMKNLTPKITKASYNLFLTICCNIRQNHVKMSSSEKHTYIQTHTLTQTTAKDR